MRASSKPYEPSESIEVFAMLQAMPSIEIPYSELCLRFVNLELQVSEHLERQRRTDAYWAKHIIGKL